MKRFFYVGRGTKSVFHRHYNAIAVGAAMACGRRLSGSYMWYSPKPRGARVCKQCERARG